MVSAEERSGTWNLLVESGVDMRGKAGAGETTR